MDREISYDARDNYNLVHPDLQHELARGQPAAVLEAWNSSLRFQSTDGSIYNHFTVPWWHERRAYKIDLAIFDSLRASPAKGVELTLFSGVAEVLRPYSGALLCVPERFVASGFEDAINDVLERWTPGSALSKGSEGRGPGRPPELKESVKEAYRSLYPTGHGDIAKGVVLSAIVKRIGREASVQTLDRAIKEIGEERCIKQV
jgi:hypothetical protein